VIAAPATLLALEWPSLLALVADEARTDLGAERVLGLLPAGDEAELVARRAAFLECRRLGVDGPLVPAFGERFAPLLDRLGSGRPPLEGPEILVVARLLAAGGEALARIRGADPPCPELAAAAAAVGDPAPLVARVRRVLDPKGRVRDDASPRLAELGREVRAVRDRLYGRLESVRTRHAELFGEETVPLRGGRLLLLLSSGARGRLQGLVHGRSASGRSFYFEPLEAVEENNQLETATEEQEAERRRLLAELLAALEAERDLVAGVAGAVARLDALEAAGRFAAAASARLAEIAPAGRLRLVGARHPLLDPRLAVRRERVLGAAGHTEAEVPLDLELSAERRVLVVTGPNAGGKTVAAKTVGLLALAAQAGLPVPCESGSELPVLSHVVATVGDEQDLLAERSTFSGRLLRLAEAWQTAGPASLALLDELGSGTDPEEGSALAVALLEHLLARRGLGVVTTHLTALAAAALERDGAACAAMEFDPDSGRPTFRLRPGAPGGSEALALARRLDLPAAWITRAEALLGGEHRELRRLLAELEATRAELARSAAAADTRAAEAATAAARLERERAALEAERQVVGRRLGDELRAFRERVSKRLVEEERNLRREFERGRRRGVAGEATARLFAEAPAPEAEPEEAAAGPLVPGARVRHRGLGWTGRLEQLDGARAEVAVAGKRVRAASADLIAIAGTEEPAARRGAAAGSGAGLGEADEPETGPELLLIGTRVETALGRLDDYLDRALAAGRSEVRVVHGHGTGRLRRAVREHLHGHPAVADFRPGGPREGGDGATVVTLRS
jgi:DNA mismatch repair protein MutS2